MNSKGLISGNPSYFDKEIDFPSKRFRDEKLNKLRGK